MTRDLLRYLPLLAVMLIGGASVDAAEYFVSKQGNDAHDGLSREAAFATIQKGIDVLQPGDTLTIAPGEYGEGVARNDLGSDAAQTTIRAEIPGTVLLRGDVPGPAFTAVEGKRFVHVADFDSAPHGAPQAVIEHTTRTLLSYTADPAELEFIPGLFHYDPHAKKLYVSSADMQSPVGRTYTVAVRNVSGIYLGSPRRVTIDGLAMTGFYRIGAHRPAPCLWNIPWGIALFKSTDCIVRNCATYLNAGGIALDQGVGNLVDGCVSFGNHSRYDAMAGNIMSFGGQGREGTAGNIIRNSVAFDGALGIHQYGWMLGHVVIRDCVAWNNKGSNLHVKTGRSEDNRMFGMIERSVAIGTSAGGVTTRHNMIVGSPQHESVGHTDIRTVEHPDLDLTRELADPDNLDFRLQADSRFRGASADGTDQGPHAYQANVFYVRPDGDDAASGLSMAAAWRTLDRATQDLRPGDTLYLAGGNYASQLVLNVPGAGGDPVHVRGRGRAPVVIEGGLSVTGSAALQVERLTFAGPVDLRDGANVTLNNCTFTGGLKATALRGLRVTHCVFPGSTLHLERSSGVHLSGNLFANQDSPAVVIDDIACMRYSDYNGYRSPAAAWSVATATWSLADLQKWHDAYSSVVQAEADAAALAGRGPRGESLGIHHDRRLESPPLRLIGPFVHSVTDTTANIEWWTTGPTGLKAAWGETAQMSNTAAVEAHRFGTFSLKGLKPGTTYHFKLTADELPDQGVTISFTTAKSQSQARAYHVAPDGDDARSGLSRDQAWRTINHAADRVRPGDTVLLSGGVFTESVRVRATGDRDRPIIFKAAPGEKVIISGDSRALACAFSIANKAYLHFDGLYFHGFSLFTYELPWSDRLPGNGYGGLFVLYRADDVRLTRCFKDGRGAGYSPAMVLALHANNLSVSNSVCIAAMGGGLVLWDCPDARIENNVFLQNLISHGEWINEPSHKIHVCRNIFTDNIASKVGAAIFSIGRVESLAEGDNCLFLRVPDDVKRPFEFYGKDAYGRPARMFSMREVFDVPPMIDELTQMSLAEYQKRFNPASNSFVADPGLVASRDTPELDRRGKPLFPVDYVMGKDTLDFPDLFATNSEVVKRGIGLQREAFSDFHFNQHASLR